jgi:hypothetical protein
MAISVSGNSEINEHVDLSVKFEVKSEPLQRVPPDDVIDSRKFDLQFTASQNKFKIDPPIEGVTAQESNDIDAAVQAVEQSMVNVGDNDAAVELALQLNGRSQEYRVELLDKLIDRWGGDRIGALIAAAAGPPRTNYERRITRQQQEIIAQTLGEAYDAGVVGSEFVEQLLNAEELVQSYNQPPITDNNAMAGTIIGLSSSSDLRLDFARRAITRGHGDGPFDRLLLLDAAKAVSSSGNLLGEVLPDLTDVDLQFITGQNPELTAQLLETSNFIQYRDGDGNPAVSPDALRIFYAAAGMNTGSAALRLAEVEFFARNGVDIAMDIHTNRIKKDSVQDFFVNYVYTVSPNDRDNEINKLIYGEYLRDENGLPIFEGGAIQNILAELTQRADDAPNSNGREAAGYAFGTILGVMLDAATEVREGRALTADRIAAVVSSVSNYAVYRGVNFSNWGDVLGQIAKEVYLNGVNAEGDQQTIENFKEDFLDGLQRQVEELSGNGQLSQANELDDFREGIESGLIART